MIVQKFEKKSKFFFSQLIILNLFFGFFSFFVLYKSIALFGIQFNLLNFPIQIVNIILAVFFLSLSLAFKNQQKVMALFWTFQLFFFGLTGLLNILDPAPLYLTQIATFSDLQKASLYTLVGQIFVAGSQLYFTLKKEDSDFNELQLVLEDYQRAKRRTRNILLLYITLLPIVINSLGGIAFLLRRTRYGSNGSNLSTASEAFLQSVLHVPPLICLLTLFYFGNKFEKPRKTTICLLLVWIIFLSNPLANARQTTLFLLLPIIFFFLKDKRIATNCFFLLLPLLLIYSANLVDRFTGQLNPFSFNILSRRGDFDAFAQFANGIRLVDNDIFPYFQQILGPVLFFVPRSIWNSKPRDTGSEIANQLSLTFQNLSAPWILEAYANANLVGLIMTSVFLGFFLSKHDMGSLHNLRGWLFGSILIGVLFIVLRGSLLQATGRVIFSFAIVYYVTSKFKIKSF
jgi:hypothetical protein